MKLIRWAQDERTLDVEERAEFFGGAHDGFTAFHFTTRKLEVPPHGGPLSLKVVFAGEERYFIGRRTVTLAPGQALLVNAGEEYASAIGRTQTESLSLFIPANEAACALAALAQDEADLLERAESPCPEVAQAAFRMSAALAAAVAGLRAAGAANAEQARAATSAALADNLALARRQALTVSRRAVRDEVLTRLLRARDYIADRHGADTPLGALAEVACMSPYHFVRRFSEAFGRTPGSFARDMRLARARTALASGGERTRVARQAGYRSYRALARALAER